jgi:hypothetical protein
MARLDLRDELHGQVKTVEQEGRLVLGGLSLGQGALSQTILVDLEGEGSI